VPHRDELLTWLQEFDLSGPDDGSGPLTPWGAAAAVARLDLFARQLLDVCATVAERGQVRRADVARAVGDLATAEQLDRGLQALSRERLLQPGGALADLSYVLDYRPLGLGRPVRERLARVDAASVRRMADTLGLGAVPTRVAAIDLIEPFLSDLDAVQTLVGDAPEPARALLTALDAGSGATRDPSVQGYGVRRSEPQQWLAERALLVPAEWGTLEVPREVALALRGGRLVRRLDPERPAVPVAEARPAADVDRAASTAAHRLLDAAGALCEAIDEVPLTRLKDGGVGLREVRRLAPAVGRDERGVISLLTLLAAAGLLDAGSTVRLDASYDRWAASPRPCGTRRCSTRGCGWTSRSRPTRPTASRCRRWFR